MCGNGTTNAGLTVAVVKDPMTSGYAFEAGSTLASLSHLYSLVFIICSDWLYKHPNWMFLDLHRPLEYANLASTVLF